jgi:hypothetical protein
LFTGLVLLSGSVHENVNGLKLADKNWKSLSNYLKRNKKIYVVGNKKN